MISKFYKIPGWEDLYAINKEGQVFSIRSNKLLRMGMSKHGQIVVLCNNTYRKTYKISHLMKLVFLDKNKEIHHIDGNKYNNKLENLKCEEIFYTCKQKWGKRNIKNKIIKRDKAGRFA